MGRGQKRSWGGGGGRGGGRGGNSWQQDKRPKKDYLGRDDLHNAAFEEYYKAQEIVPEGEWAAFLATLRRPLPVTFRINGSGKFADHLRDKLKHDFFAKLSGEELTVDGEPVTAPRQLPWYPHGYAWQLEFSRNQLRKLPLLAAIHDFVKHANDAGSISRQEAVSMVPPLFLDVQPQHRVLDMCAAPGSKTFQLLEALHAGSRPGQTPAGLVVANDADFMRCNLLTHQTKRVCSPCLMVTNHDASRFPTHLAGVPPQQQPQQQQPHDAGVVGAEAGATAAAAAAKPQRVEVRFDRILADVPCSGDGTLRKSPDIWRRWNISGGNGLHSMQLRIAMHGAKLLEVGGRMVYSTCTFNPVEDEAVVAELLLRCGGALELVDVADCLPELRRMPGKTHWKVRDRNRFYDSWEEAREVGFKLEASMFSSPEKAALPLHRCMRFLPHHGDTGGFFVAVLRKVAELPGKEQQQQKGAAAGGEEEKQQEEQQEVEVEAVGAEVVVDGMEGVERPEGGEEAVAAEAGTGPAETEPQAAEAPAATTATPFDAARAAAEAAVAAAEAALAAFEAGEYDNATRAAANADACARKAAAAVSGGQGASRKPRAEEQQQPKQEAKQPKQEAATADDEDAAAAVATAAPTADGEQLEGEQDAAGPSSSAPAGPIAEVSWIRGGGGRGRPEGGKFAYIDPVAPVEDEGVLGSLYEYYGIAPDFPLRSQLLMRSLEQQPKRLYFVCRSLLEVMLADSREAVKVVATGLKVFERQVIRDQVNECPYRLAQEGLPLVLPYITRQRIEVPPGVLLQLLRDRNLILPEAAATEGDTTASGNPRGTKPTLSDPAVLAALEPLKLGCVVCELSAEDARRLGFAASTRAAPAEARALAAGGAPAAGAGADGGEAEEVTGGLSANAPLAVVAWKGKASLSIMVEKAECTQMIDKLEAELKKVSPSEA